ncbi:cytochrome P450 [Pseudomonas gingeri]|uniref:cytochrome P450 n=1 Tax=Pseudomonas gingeri TaxID=117681 RepID=UPI0015A1FB08|nr:cytochrome P450 [Pseudomonas gingeri]NWA28611.1 cytochrome P450 [Pseudomonas gingeri]
MFNPVEFVRLRDRYPTYREMRDNTPVIKVENGHAPNWILTRYEDVSLLLKNPQARVKPAGGAPAWLGNGAAAAMFDAQLVLTDPPNHDRLRRLVSPAFTVQALRPLESWIHEMVNNRVEELAGRDSFDLVNDLASFVPATTILHILGVPSTDWEPLISRVPAFLHLFSPFPIMEEQREACEAACQFYIDYFDNIVKDRWSNPGDDIVGKLISVHQQDPEFTRIELLSMLHAFLNAGFETTMSALGGGLFGMLSQGDPWKQLCEDPTLAGAALEETLRFDPPVHFMRRFPVEDTNFSGIIIPAGDSVQVCLASANRDERKFSDPDRIDIHRADKNHVTFGGGRHFCIGAMLAKLEARTTLEAIARKLPNLELLDLAPERQEHLMFHAIKNLKVSTGSYRI